MEKVVVGYLFSFLCFSKQFAYKDLKTTDPHLY